MFELAEASTLNAEDKLTAALVLVEVLKGSRLGYVKIPLSGRVVAQDAPIRHPGTESK